LWYMDDGTLGGHVDVLLDDFERVRRVGSELGLVLNEAKCELVTDDPAVVAKFRVVAPTILHVRTSDATLLGAPVGSNCALDYFGEESRRISAFG